MVDQQLTSKNVVFLGPAQQEFSTLQEQGTQFLDTYWSYWRNYVQPESHIVPPIFTYQHADVSDSVWMNFEKEQQNRKNQEKVHPIIRDRNADNAEYMLYSAIHHLTQDQTHGLSPFIAIRGLDLFLNPDKNGDLRGHLTSIFPNLNWEIFKEKLALAKGAPNAEFDFILIGPKIGLVVIEVKSSKFTKFTKAAHFSKARFLPDSYKEGLAQLNQIHALMYLLQECATVPPGKSIEIPVRKLLFTPGLTKQRFDNFVEKLKASDRTENVDKKIIGIDQWFQEHATDSDDNVILRTNLHKFLLACKPIPTCLYEAYAPILTAMASMAVYTSADASTVTIDIDRLKLVEFEAIAKVDECIDNPYKDQKRSALCHVSKKDKVTLVNAQRRAIDSVTKIVLLSPDQRRALKGQRRQFLVGAPGTGKTLLLQKKALELLQNGRSVTILAPKSYMLHYKILFDKHGYKNYKIRYWSLDKIKETYKLIEQQDGRAFSEINLTSCIYEYVKTEFSKGDNKILEHFTWFDTDDDFIIDDAFDQEANKSWAGSFFIGPLLTMAFAELRYPEKVVWAALDPYAGYGVGYPYRKHGYTRIVTELLNSLDNPKSNGVQYYTVAPLRQVMRCSENIFELAFHKSMNWPSALKPIPGHKIKGLEVTSIVGDYPKYELALQALWDSVKSTIKRFEEGFDLGGIALIVGTYPELDSSVRRFLRKNCEKYWPVHSVDKCKLENMELCPDANIRTNPSALTVEDWNVVSSLEWPVVIYTSCLPKDLEPCDVENVVYQKYRALTRAKAKLIDINITYDWNALTDEDEPDEGLGRWTYTNEPNADRVESDEKSRRLTI